MMKPVGGRGGWSRSNGLQSGQGIPAPPHPQALEPSQGRYLWVSHTQPVLSQRVQFTIFIVDGLSLLAAYSAPPGLPWRGSCLLIGSMSSSTLLVRERRPP